MPTSLPEVAQAGSKLTDKTPGSGFGIAAPEEDHIGIFGNIFDHVIGRMHHTDNALAPNMLGAEVPAFPAIRFSDHLGKTADFIQQQTGLAVRGIDGLAFAMSITLQHDGQRTIFLMDSFDFIGDQGGGFVPGDADEFALAAVLGISFTFGIPVNSL